METRMLDTARIVEIAKQVAAQHLPPKSVGRVEAEAETASDGTEALHILIVLQRGALKKIAGDVALDTSVDLQSRLTHEGEPRFAYVDYATEEDLAAANDD